jgi:hypothetical protein
MNIWAILFMNGAAVKIHAQIFGWIYVSNSLGYNPGIGVPGHVATLCLTFGRVRNSFPQQLCQFTFQRLAVLST